jgi:hypothetical protein
MKKTKRIIKKQTKKRINKKQTKKRINKKQTKKRNKKTFYMQRGGPKKLKVSDAQEAIDPHVQEDIDNLLANAPQSSLQARSASVPRWPNFIPNTKRNAGILIDMIDRFFTSCGIKKEYYIIEDTRTFFLYFMVGTEKIYFLYTTASISKVDEEDVLDKIEDVLDKIEYESSSTQEKYKALFNETPEYARYTLHVLFQMCVLNGFAFTTIAESYLMAQFFLRDNIVFAEKEDTTDQSAMAKNFNNFLGYFSYDPVALEFKQDDYLIPPDMAASASAAESQEDQLSSLDSSSTYGSTQAEASQMAYASQDERDEADDDFDPEELMVIPTDSKRALVPETLEYLVKNLPTKIDNAQSKWHSNQRKILQHYTEEAIALTQKSDFWKFEGPQQYHDSEVSQDDFFAPPAIDI